MLEKWGGGTLQRNGGFGVLGSALRLSQAFPQLGACGCALGAGLGNASEPVARSRALREAAVAAEGPGQSLVVGALGTLRAGGDECTAAPETGPGRM